MPRVVDPFRFVQIAEAAWMKQRHLQAIDYLREEANGKAVDKSSDMSSFGIVLMEIAAARFTTRDHRRGASRSVRPVVMDSPWYLA